MIIFRFAASIVIATLALALVRPMHEIGENNASPIPPSHKHIERIMAILRNKPYHPIYSHCAYGRDRTSLVAARYKMYFLGMSQQDALRYMDESGYKDSRVRGASATVAGFTVIRTLDIG